MRVDQRYSPYTNPSSLSSRSSSESPCPWNTELSLYKDGNQVSTESAPYSSDSELSLYSNELDTPFYQKDLNNSTALADKLSANTTTTSDLEHSPQPGCNTNTDSGYESEASRSSSTAPEPLSPSDTSDEESKMGRRFRTAFTSDQISTLEKTFQKQRYLGASERRKLAAKLQLSEIQIKTWFQNRRMKYKREIQDGRPDSYHPEHFFSLYGYTQQPSPVFQHTVQQPYSTFNPLMNAMPYTVHAPVMGSVNPFNSPPMQMTYLNHHSLAQPIVYHEERPFGRY
ncbi:hypothetical protein GDO86_013301 [Hymenochirus boettgeri]|uniref:Homeobox domain-containing protein n=1 Tax=Hymenochirus boettgeri TaxID=247094 RepID=A0A8T2IW56_9PIPI|nr:hypothetical protein GDO86_013301 [Hymenochirus boettgeri]